MMCAAASGYLSRWVMPAIPTVIPPQCPYRSRSVDTRELGISGYPLKRLTLSWCSNAKPDRLMFETIDGMIGFHNEAEI